MSSDTALAPAPVSPLRSGGYHVLALFFAVAGGALGIGGAIIAEIQSASSGGFLLGIIGAPLIEEAMKPAGLYILLVKWPQALRGRLHTAALAGISGLCFGLIEAWVYVNVYVSNPPDWFVTYRFTAPLALHATASFVYGLGLNRGLIDWTQGRSPLPKSTRNLYIAAAAMHAVFNATVIVLTLAGVFPSG
jgi:RsiW-degrading membrane proteinase PrsW (M82 family)